MAALTANRDTLVHTGQQQKTGVKAATKIYGGSIVMLLNTTGLAQPGADTAGLVLPGIALAKADNTSGAAGAIKCPIQRGCVAKVKYTGTAPKPGETVYVSDDQTVALSTTNSVGAMKVVSVDTSSTSCEVFVPVA